LTTSDIIGHNGIIFREGGETMKEEIKAVNVRMPAYLHSWLRDEAARATLREKRVVSINSLIVEILEAERHEEQGPIPVTPKKKGRK